MKCIKFYRQYGGHITRVSEAEAVTQVNARRAIYAPKKWLRAARMTGALKVK